MRCRYCNKKMEQHEYKYDPDKKDFVEVCRGRCVMSKEDRAELDEMAAVAEEEDDYVPITFLASGDVPKT